MVWLRGLKNLFLRNRLLIQPSSRDFSSSLPGSKGSYTPEQKQTILNRLNDNDVGRLPKKVAQALKDRLDQNKPFDNLEQLLELPGVGPKSIRTICEKILNGVEEPSSDGSLKKRRKSLFSVPVVKLDKQVSSLVSVFVDAGAVSWAKLNLESKSVVDWEFQTFEDSLELMPLIQQAVSIEKLLPDADVYVLEENNRISYGKGNASTLCLTCMMSTVLHLKRDSENKGRIVFLKSRLVDRHYNAIVGNETVSVQPIVEDMIHGRDEPTVTVYNNRYSRFYIGPPLAAYMKKKGPYEKELLSRAALIGICLTDLTLSSVKK